MRKIVEMIERLNLIGWTTVAVGVLWIGLDFFGIFPFPEKEFPQILMVLIGSILISLHNAREEIREKQNSIQALIEALVLPEGLIIHRFSTPSEMYEYTIHRIRESRHIICDLSWTRGLVFHTTRRDEEAYLEYLKTIATIRTKPQLEYRDIAIFWHESDIERAERLLKQGLYGYQLRFYKACDDIPPLLEFIIIDDEEVILAFYDELELSKNGLYLSIRHPDIVKYFRSYYDILWRKALPLKEAGEIYDLQKLEAERARLQGLNKSFT